MNFWELPREYLHSSKVHTVIVYVGSTRNIQEPCDTLVFCWDNCRNC